MAWATAPNGAPWWHAMRLSAVRRFALYLRRMMMPYAEIGIRPS